MAEAVYSPEVFSIKPPERGPMDRVKRKVFDFVKSQAPEAHARRTMERYDWVGDQLDGKSRELFETMRPAVEKAAKVAGVSTTAMEIIFATQVAAALAILGGKVGGDLLVKMGVQDGVGKVRDEIGKIFAGAYGKAKKEWTAGLGALGAGGAFKWYDNLKNRATTPAPETPLSATSVKSESATVASASPVDHSTRVETVLPSEMVNQLSDVRSYFDEALEQTDMKPTKVGRVAMINGYDSVTCLLQEIEDSVDRKISHRLMRLVIPSSKKVIVLDMSDKVTRGWVDKFDAEAFESVTSDIEQGILHRPTRGESLPRRKMFDSEFNTVIQFVKKYPLEPQSPPAA